MEIVEKPGISGGAGCFLCNGAGWWRELRRGTHLGGRARLEFGEFREQVEQAARDDGWDFIQLAEHERRAEAAVIAWMRHQTTSYDSMKIARVKGQRREVRRMLAERSKELLGAYRRGEGLPKACPLAEALREQPVLAE